LFVHVLMRAADVICAGILYQSDAPLVFFPPRLVFVEADLVKNGNDYVWENVKIQK